MFTDTDTLTYEIQRENLYKDLKKGEGLSHFSDYPEGEKGYFQHSNKNNKVVRKYVGKTNLMEN